MPHSPRPPMSNKELLRLIIFCIFSLLTIPIFGLIYNLTESPFVFLIAVPFVAPGFLLPHMLIGHFLNKIMYENTFGPNSYTTKEVNKMLQEMKDNGIIKG